MFCLCLYNCVCARVSLFVFRLCLYACVCARFPLFVFRLCLYVCVCARFPLFVFRVVLYVCACARLHACVNGCMRVYVFSFTCAYLSLFVVAVPRLCLSLRLRVCV